MNDLISIIIPAYNVGDCITKTIQSVLDSRYTNIEVICIDDGSTDNTATILDEYATKDSRIRVIHKENGGVASARLCGIEEAKGEWIGFVDGDDIIDADMYERLMANVTSEEVDISHCGYKKIFLDGTVKYYHDTGKKIEQDNGQGLKDLLEANFVEPGLWNKLYRKKLFVGLKNWLDCSIKINEDLLMNFYLFRNARQSVYEDFCPYTYILRWGSAMTSVVNQVKLYDPIRVIDLLLEETKDVLDLQTIMKNRLVYVLIFGATREHNGQKDVVIPFRKYALKRLRENLKKILFDKSYTKKIKLSTLWVCIWPASYRWVHIFYGKMRRRYKKENGISIWS